MLPGSSARRRRRWSRPTGSGRSSDRGRRGAGGSRRRAGELDRLLDAVRPAASSPFCTAACGLRVERRGLLLGRESAWTVAEARASRPTGCCRRPSWSLTISGDGELQGGPVHLIALFESQLRLPPAAGTCSARASSSGSDEEMRRAPRSPAAAPSGATAQARRSRDGARDRAEGEGGLARRGRDAARRRPRLGSAHDFGRRLAAGLGSGAGSSASSSALGLGSPARARSSRRSARCWATDLGLARCSTLGGSACLGAGASAPRSSSAHARADRRLLDAVERGGPWPMSFQPRSSRPLPKLPKPCGRMAGLAAPLRASRPEEREAKGFVLRPSAPPLTGRPRGGRSRRRGAARAAGRNPAAAPEKTVRRKFFSSRSAI